ncbi:NAD(P)-binding protein [Auriculariales sp. MPI-PUGE-AT-0066]|nr:NAD(P)-binding protein [Auriculariales sp. MPI-PUGE-AT-0066]
MTATLPTTQKRWIWPGKVNGVDVLVRIHAVSLNFRELMIASGIYPGARTEGLTPGCDPAGEVVRAGPGVAQQWKEGDRVTATFFLGDTGVGMGLHMAGTDMGSAMQGTLVQYRVFPAAALVRIPDGLSYEEAATFSCAGVTAYNALLGGPRPVRPGETVLVQGTGGVALFGAQIAHASGARVVITSSSDTKLAQIQKLVPVDETVNYTTHPEWQERVLALTGGGGAHHVLDVGGAATVPRSLQAVAFGGCVSIIGSMTGVKLEWDLVSVIQKGAIVRGIPVGTRQHLEETFRLYEIRGIKPVVGRVFGFGEAKEALKTLASQDFIGKIVIKVAA